MSNCKRGCPCPDWDCNNPPTTTVPTTTTTAATTIETTTASFDDWQIELFVINPKIQENHTRHSDSKRHLHPGVEREGGSCTATTSV